MNPSLKRNPNRLLILAGFLIVGAGAYLLSRGTSGSPATQASEQPATDGHEVHREEGLIHFDRESLQLASLQIERVGYRPLTTRLQVAGTVEVNPAGMANVTARVPGKVMQILVNVGDTVREGQPLAVIASTELANAQAAYRQASTRLAVAQNNLERQKRLAALGEFSRPKLEEARRANAEAQSELQTAEGELASAQAELTEAQSQLLALQAALTQAESQQQVVQSRLQRAEMLYKEQLLSKQDYEQAQADSKKAEADLEAVRANLQQGEAKVKSTSTRLQTAQKRYDLARQRAQTTTQALEREEAIYQGGYLTSKELVEAEAALRQAQIEQKAAADNVRLLGGTPGGGNLVNVVAPIRGRIIQRLATLGETVSSEKSLFTIFNLDTVWVQLNVYQQDAPAVRTGQAVAVTCDSVPGHTFRGVISHLSDTVDETTRTVKVRCIIQNEGNRLKPNMFISGVIQTGRRGRVLAVPKEAVQEMEGKQVVFVPTEQEGEFKAQEVEVGEEVEGYLEIRSGLKAGDRIVTQNAFLVKAQAMKSELGEEGHGH